MRVAVAFGPYSEFHGFSRFDCSFLKKLKTQYEKIIAVVPYTAASCITYADEILCVSTQFLAKFNGHYPQVLNQNGRDTVGYLESGFLRMAVDYSNNYYPGCDFYYFHEGPQQYMDKGIIAALPPNCQIFNQDTEPQYKNDCWNQWFMENGEISRSIDKDNNFIYPFEEDKQTINDKYKHMFSKPTFIFLTRNFTWKATLHNTRKDIIPFMENILECDYGVVNIGFPGLETGIKHEKYFEVNDILTYSEFVCLMYMSKGMFIQGGSASPGNHLRVKIPIIVYSDLISIYKPIFNSRTNKEIYTKQINMYNDEGGVVSREELNNILNECKEIKYENEYISNKHCILLDRI